MSAPVFIAVGEGENQETFTVFRAVLAQHSEVFEDMFFGPNADNSEVINLPEDNPEIFSILLRYDKTGKCEFKSVEEAISTYYFFDKYLTVGDTKILCSSYLKQSINSDNVGKILETSIDVREDSLSYICWFSILMRTESVLNNKAFTNLKAETVSAIIRQDIMTGGEFEVINETTVYKALVEWGKEEWNRNEWTGEKRSLREILEPFLCHIRFLLMTREDFTEEVCRDGILTDREQLEVLKALRDSTTKISSQYLSVSKKQRKLPENVTFSLFCCSTGETNKEQSLISEYFRSNSHNLFIRGVLAFSNWGDIEDCTLTVRIVAKQKGEKSKVSKTKINKTLERREVLYLASPVFIARGEVFEIILQSDSDKLIPCCTRKCDIHPLLERVTDFPSSIDSTGHFSGIYALFLNP